jgi:hypothetical protein
MKNKIKITNNESDSFVFLLLKFWESKTLILSTAFLLALLGLFYMKVSIKNHSYLATVTINSPDITSFIFFNGYASIDDYKKYFFSNLVSRDFVAKFALESNKLDILKRYLSEKEKEKDTPNSEEKSLVNYFEDRIYFDEKKKNKYYIDYNDYFDGEVFLDELVEFTKDNTIKLYVEDLRYILSNNLEIFKRELVIAKDLELSFPRYLQKIRKYEDKTEPAPGLDGYTMILNLENKIVNPELYKYGSIVLSKRIEHLEYLLSQTNYDKFNYNPIINKSLTTKTFRDDKILFPFIGLFTGFFLSVLYVFLREIIEKK